MQHPESDDAAWQACVVRHREVTGMGWDRCGPAPIHAPTPRPGSARFPDPRQRAGQLVRPVERLSSGEGDLIGADGAVARPHLRSMRTSHPSASAKPCSGRTVK